MSLPMYDTHRRISDDVIKVRASGETFTISHLVICY